MKEKIKNFFKWIAITLLVLLLLILMMGFFKTVSDTFSSILLGSIIGFTIVVIVKSLFLPGQGKIYVVLRGEIFSHAIMNVDGWHLNDPREKSLSEGGNYDPNYPDWETLPNKWSSDVSKYTPQGYKKGTPTPNEYKSKKDFFLENFGVYFVWWPVFKIYNYIVFYTSVVNKGKEDVGDSIIWTSAEGQDQIVARKRMTNYIPFQQNYPTLVDGAETATEGTAGVRQQIPLTLMFNSTVRARNPERMLFKTTNYIQKMHSSLQGAVRDICGIKTVEEINKMQNEAGGEGTFSNLMPIINNRQDNANDGVTELFGFELLLVNFEGYEGATEQAKIVLQAPSRVYVAEQGLKEAEFNGKSLGVTAKEKRKGEAEGEEIFITKTGEAKNKILEKEYSIKGKSPKSVRVALAEAIKDHKGTLVLGKGVLPTVELKEENNE